MIRIKKPSEPPNTLKTKGKDKTAEMETAFDTYKKDYLSKKKKFRFDRNIYAHKTIKSALLKAQSDKCFLCESKVTHVGHGDVEHFRPKGGYKQSSSEKIQPPGYYWLAYEWSNLFFSCQICNQTFKKNLFPLKSLNQRAKSHKDDINKEDPLFINPSLENPEQHITFNRHIPVPQNNSERGKATIDLLGLRRKKLNDYREGVYESAKYVFIVAQEHPNPTRRKEAQQYLRRLQRKSSQYALMIKCAIKNNFSL